MTPGTDTLLPALSAILSSWVCGWLIFIGIGLLLTRADPVESGSAGYLLDCFWTGWAASLVVLMYWHFPLPVDWRAAAVIAFMGCVGWAIHGKRVFASF